MIAKSDVFVFLDDVQYTTRDWRSRNQIKSQNGLKWLTIPVGNSRNSKIYEVNLPITNWPQSHGDKVFSAYQNSINFDFGMELLEEIYNPKFKTLSEFNQYWIKYIANEILGLKCDFLDSRDLSSAGSGSERILSICKSLNAKKYLSGPSAQNYLELDTFQDAGIDVYYADYSKLPNHNQLHGEFIPNVSILDLIFNESSELNKFIEIGMIKT